MQFLWRHTFQCTLDWIFPRFAWKLRFVPWTSLWAFALRHPHRADERVLLASHVWHRSLASPAGVFVTLCPSVHPFQQQGGFWKKQGNTTDSKRIPRWFIYDCWLILLNCSWLHKSNIQKEKLRNPLGIKSQTESARKPLLTLQVLWILREFVPVQSDSLGKASKCHRSLSSLESHSIHKRTVHYDRSFRAENVFPPCQQWLFWAWL